MTFLSGRAAIASEIKKAGEGGYSVPEANIVVKELDLNDLRSVERFAKEVLAGEERIDLLVNNAGIMALKDLEFTKQGFEKQIGVNHFGMFCEYGSHPKTHIHAHKSCMCSPQDTPAYTHICSEQKYMRVSEHTS